MLNIKDNGFGVPKTYIKILNYDSHEYKEERLVSKHDDDENVRLIDRRNDFKKDLKRYKKDLFEMNKKKKDKTKIKTDEEVENDYNSSKIMRSFRLSINHIELNYLHKSNDSEEQKKQNIINFYKSCLDKVEDILNRNNKFNQNVKIVQADIHFDQTSPHLHFHVSNLYERNSVLLDRNMITCNLYISDLINHLKQEKVKQNDKTNSINERFSHELKKQNSDYFLVNKVDLKKLWPDPYNLIQHKKDSGLDTYVAKQWRIEKEIFFDKIEDNLNKLNLEIDKENNIENTRKLDEVTNYMFMQTLALHAQKEIDNRYDKEIIDQEKEFLNIINNPNFQVHIMNYLNDKDYGNHRERINFDNLIEKSNKQLKPLSKYFPELKSIEDELISRCKLFEKNKNLEFSKGIDLNKELTTLERMMLENQHTYNFEKEIKVNSEILDNSLTSMIDNEPSLEKDNSFNIGEFADRTSSKVNDFANINDQELSGKTRNVLDVEKEQSKTRKR